MSHLVMSPSVTGFSAAHIHHFDFARVMDRARAEFGEARCEQELLDICFPRPRCIFIRRADRVRQAISFIRALDTMEWERLRHEPVRERTLAVDIDIDRIEAFINVFAEQEKQWSGFFARNGIPFCEVVYEDLVSDYQGTVLRVLDFLEVPHPGFRLGAPRTVKQSDDLTERAVARYAARLKTENRQSANHVTVGP